MAGTDSETLKALSDQCRRMARGASTRDVANSLNEMAAGYEAAASRASGAARTAGEPPPLPDRDE